MSIIQNETDLCNHALMRLGEPSIVNYTSDNTPTGRRLRTMFPSIRRSELQKHTWAFAKKRVILAPDTDAPAFDYTYQFSLPADFLRLIPNPELENDWVIEADKILTNDSNILYFRYIADIDNLQLWDASFYEAVSIQLAIALCEVFTSNANKRQALMQEYEQAIRQARRSNAFDSPTQTIPTQSFINARF